MAYARRVRFPLVPVFRVPEEIKGLNRAVTDWLRENGVRPMHGVSTYGSGWPREVTTVTVHVDARIESQQELTAYAGDWFVIENGHLAHYSNTQYQQEFLTESE